MGVVLGYLARVYLLRKFAARFYFAEGGRSCSVSSASQEDKREGRVSSLIQWCVLERVGGGKKVLDSDSAKASGGAVIV